MWRDGCVVVVLVVGGRSADKHSKPKQINFFVSMKKSRGDTTRVSPVELKTQADDKAADCPRLHDFAMTSSNSDGGTVAQDAGCYQQTSVFANVHCFAVALRLPADPLGPRSGDFPQSKLNEQ